MQNLSDFGSNIRELRIQKKIPQRKVAAVLDIDTSTLSKIERGERDANKEMIKLLAEFFDMDEKELKQSFLSDKIARQIYIEPDSSEILHLAEEKVRYLKNTKSQQSTINLK